ncbi:unnamed protein product [Brachionus calyciflorus]|uniref:Pathogen-related protein n=1 Tax=Brachionus calyciflorus TaxID=104777 RepID=A0A813UZC4_9BILA|nr:unnamed protein product [Brachionus calyciflorus]
MELQKKESAKKELEELKLKYNFVEPNRGNLDDEQIEWRDGKPDYTLANLEYFKGKKMNHKADSLEKLVEDLVKTWEMEGSHKVNVSQWTTIDHENYKVCSNGGRVFVGEESIKIGNYNWLFDGCPKDLYDTEKETFESSHDLFRGSFTNGFPWELIKVFSGPPKVTFMWRHWGNFTGKYREHVGNCEFIELYGFAVVTVNDNLKIQFIEIFYDPNTYLEVLQRKKSADELINGKPIVGGTCPFINSKNF